jgi:hypothetical protein
MTLAVPKRISQMKNAERRDKKSVRPGKDPRAGKPRKPSKTPAMFKKTPLACERNAT